MKTILVLAAVVAVSIANTIPADNILGEERFSLYPRYLEMADPEGVMHTIDLEAEVDPVALEEARNPANNAYYLYTRNNRILAQTLTINNANSVRNSNFDPNKPTHVLVHGWLGSRRAEPGSSARTALLNAEDCNVIVMDWSRLASSLYNTAANGVPAVGRGLGQFMNFLHNSIGLAYSNMHLVGFSLGAHLVGNAGRECGGRIARITGLDPAGPLWNYNRDRLAPSDAVYVECIHTGGGLSGLGIASPIGNSDFFPNGGSSMPGCLTANCDHHRSCEYYGATVSNRHMHGTGCSSMTQVSLNTCRGSSLEMGNHLRNKWGTGIYRLTTGRSHPF